MTPTEGPSGRPDGPPAADTPLPGTVDCPRRTAGLEGIGGAVGPDPADFRVDEIANYAPEGEGDHWFVRIRKVGLSTPAARNLIARAAGVDARDVGFAGRKDTHAITTQWFSLPAKPGAEAPEIAPVEGIELLEYARHGRKLRLGHLAGNRFTIRLLGVADDAEARLPALVDALAAGMPNYYGGQRFGSGGRSLRQALAFAAKPRRRVRDPKFLASVLQAAIFNRWLGARLAEGLLDTAIEGDVLRKRETGGVFVCADADADGPRVLAGEVDPTGPMPGGRLMGAEGPAAAREQAAAALFGTDIELTPLQRFAPGTRRVARVVPQDLGWSRETVDRAAIAGADPADRGGLTVCFTLPPGCYATVVLGELCGTPAGDGEPATPG